MVHDQFFISILNIWRTCLELRWFIISSWPVLYLYLEHLKNLFRTVMIHNQFMTSSFISVLNIWIFHEFYHKDSSFPKVHELRSWAFQVQFMNNSCVAWNVHDFMDFISQWLNHILQWTLGHFSNFTDSEPFDKIHWNSLQKFNFRLSL